MSLFLLNEGCLVNLEISVCGIKTVEECVVLRVDHDGIWLDNGPGNDPSGPYDPRTGQWTMNNVIPGSTQRIVQTVCRWPGCTGKVYSSGLCNYHFGL